MNYSLQFVKVIGTLIGVLGLFYVVVKFIKNKNLVNQTNQIKVLERCYLDSDQFICLVRVADDIWLVTSSGDRLEFINKVAIDEQEILSNQDSSAQKLVKFFQTADNEDETDEN